MTERKSDVLNLRLDPSLAKELERIAAWRELSVSEVARDLLQYGVRVERQLEAAELTQFSYGSSRVNRKSEEVRVEVDAKLRFLSRRELAEVEEQIDEERGYEQ